MKGILLKIKELWFKFAFLLGDFISSVLLTLFYYLIFGIFALPYRIIKNDFASGEATNWTAKGKWGDDLGSIKKEF
ncbi:MAG: hypothetical protein HYT12_02125 [Candidatus Liptonbacteria bacterium]|nr:hypothetical protein [Candidatus Liptonbacteria bacterium]